MSLYDYEASKRISAEDWPFYALIMAAMRRADTDNLEKLKAAFPDTWTELEERYHAPGGFVPADVGKFPWELECLLCGKFADDILAVSLAGATNALVRVQDHGIGNHGLTPADFEKSTREGDETDGYTFVLADGRSWMHAKRRTV